MNEQTEASGTWKDVRVWGIWAVILAVVIALLYQMFAISRLNNELSEQAKTHATALNQSRRDDTVRLAETLACPFDPLIYNRRPDDASIIQSTCEAIAKGGKVDLILVTDTRGIVLGSSDTKYKGQMMQDMATNTASESNDNLAWEVTRPITHEGARMGTIRIRVNYK